MNIGRPANVSATPGPHHPQMGPGAPGSVQQQQRPGISMGSAGAPVSSAGGGPLAIQGMTTSCSLPFNKFLQVVMWMK